MYQNNNYTDKWFYAFITNMTYINDYLTEIQISTDVFQTWQFDILWKKSFIEREMINSVDDIPGASRTDEGLEIGEPFAQTVTEDSQLAPLFVIAFLGDSLNFNGTINIPRGGLSINNIPLSNIALIICESVNHYTSLINIINASSMGDKIFNCFTIPRFAVPYEYKKINGADMDLPCCILSTGNYNAPITSFTFTKPTQLGNYVPRNKKLLCYPYNYFGFTAFNGNPKTFKYEDFYGNSNQVTFKRYSEANPNPTIIYTPEYYNTNIENLKTELCILSGYPTLASTEDYFNTWLAQNLQILQLSMEQEYNNYAVNNVTGGVNGVVGGTSNALAGNYGGLVSGTVSSAGSLALNITNHEIYQKQVLANVNKQALLPDNHTLGTSATMMGYNLLETNLFTHYCIREEFARRIDNFFDMYGYFVKEVKIPNLSNRPNWNYVKTIGANIMGNIPQEDLQMLKTIFDNGVTLWHNPVTFLDYSQINR